MKIARLEDKCNECLLCVKDCAAGVWREVDGVPTPAAPELCNLCSHCVSVCPREAIVHSALDAGQVRNVKKKRIDDAAYREIVLGRRSVREYKKKDLPRETIEDILDLARYSPTASNTQNVEYTVITDRELLRKVSKRIFGAGLKTNDMLKKPAGKLLTKAIEKTSIGQTLGKYMSGLEYYKLRAEKGKDYILHNAPALILIHTPAGASFACDNCNIAATNIANYAYSLGLGTCFIGFVTWGLRYDRGLGKMLKVPKGRKVHASLTVGYPAYRHAFTPSRKKATVHWIEGKKS